MCVCARLCTTTCLVVRKDKRKLIKKFLIRIFPLCIGFCSCVVGWKLNYRKFFFCPYPDSGVMMCSLFSGGITFDHLMSQSLFTSMQS